MALMGGGTFNSNKIYFVLVCYYNMEKKVCKITAKSLKKRKSLKGAG